MNDILARGTREDGYPRCFWPETATTRPQIAWEFKIASLVSISLWNNERPPPSFSTSSAFSARDCVRVSLSRIGHDTLDVISDHSSALTVHLSLSLSLVANVADVDKLRKNKFDLYQQKRTMNNWWFLHKRIICSPRPPFSHSIYLSIHLSLSLSPYA